MDINLAWHCSFDKNSTQVQDWDCEWISHLILSLFAVEKWFCQWLGEDPQLPWDSRRVPGHGCTWHDKNSQGETAVTSGYLPHYKVLVKTGSFHSDSCGIIWNGHQISTSWIWCHTKPDLPPPPRMLFWVPTLRNINAWFYFSFCLFDFQKQLYKNIVLAKVILIWSYA